MMSMVRCLSITSHVASSISKSMKINTNMKITILKNAAFCSSLPLLVAPRSENPILLCLCDRPRFFSALAYDE